MQLSRFVLSGLLLGPAVASQAQPTEPVSIPRFYGGLGVYSSSHHNLSSWGRSGARIPVQAVVGYQLRPRLAVQLGVAYSGNRSQYDDSQYNYSGPNTPVAYSIGTYTERSSTATLLARYTLTRKLQHRFQADLLGGAKFEYSSYHNAGTYYDNRPVIPTVATYDEPSHYTCALLSVGPSLRYRLVSHLEAVYDLTFDLPVSGGRYSASSYNVTPRPQATMALGLRYHFGPS